MYKQIIDGKECNIYCDNADPAALAQMYETMKQQEALVEVITYVKPLLSIKG